ncbi:MAG: LysE family translocator [Paracoccaceae bacterium]|nr:LysE family translocator [Paracoccaceae bacterium]
MNVNLLSALVGFSIVTLFTPGPNNLMLMASGINFGYRRTLPHLLGVAFGFAVMLTAVGLGLAQVFTVVPALRLVLKAVSVVFMLWLAWKIATEHAPGVEGKTVGRPLRFGQAAAFQWVNPKAWAIAITATSAYAPVAGSLGVAIVAVVFCLTGLASSNTWVLAGRAVARFLRDPRHLRRFNIVMALLLVLTLVPLLQH